MYFCLVGQGLFLSFFKAGAEIFKKHKNGRKVLVVGAGDAGVLVVKGVAASG